MAVKILNTKGTKQVLIFIGIAIILIIGFVFYFPNYTKLKTLRKENTNLLSKKEKLEEDIKELEEKINRVGKDPYLYESIARDELGVAKENEIVIDIGK
jgi:cell division protein FtsB|tara:strand:+ start:935 stop:1231 length:297 start_codon:yes stop_codon:yes gene_type:complete